MSATVQVALAVLRAAGGDDYIVIDRTVTAFDVPPDTMRPTRLPFATGPAFDAGVMAERERWKILLGL